MIYKLWHDIRGKEPQCGHILTTRDTFSFRWLKILAIRPYIYMCCNIYTHHDKTSYTVRVNGSYWTSTFSIKCTVRIRAFITLQTVVKTVRVCLILFPPTKWLPRPVPKSWNNFTHFNVRVTRSRINARVHDKRRVTRLFPFHRDCELTKGFKLVRPLNEFRETLGCRDRCNTANFWRWRFCMQVHSLAIRESWAEILSRGVATSAACRLSRRTCHGTLPLQSVRPPFFTAGFISWATRRWVAA